MASKGRDDGIFYDEVMAQRTATVPGFMYLGSSRTSLSKEELQQEPRWEMPPHFTFPPAPKPKPSKAAKKKAKKGAAKKEGARAASASNASAKAPSAPAPAQSAGPGSTPFSLKPEPRKLTESEARDVERQAAASRIDYSKWASIVDSDDEIDEEREAARRFFGGRPPLYDSDEEEEAAAESPEEKTDKKQGEAGGRPGGSNIDYSKWDALVDSDEEREREAARSSMCCHHCKTCNPGGGRGHSEDDSCDEHEDEGCETHEKRPVHTVPEWRLEEMEASNANVDASGKGDGPGPGSAPNFVFGANAQSGKGKDKKKAGTEKEGSSKGSGTQKGTETRKGSTDKETEAGKAQEKEAKKVGTEKGAEPKKAGLKGGFFGAPKKAEPSAGNAAEKDGSKAAKQQPAVDDLRIYHKLGGTAKPLTAYPLQPPEAQELWRTYIGSDGRLYFVEVGSSGAGTWWKPDALLDTTEDYTGWQELYDKSGRVYYYKRATGEKRDALPTELRQCRSLSHLQQKVEALVTPLGGSQKLDELIDKTYDLTKNATSMDEAGRIAMNYIVSTHFPDRDMAAMVAGMVAQRWTEGGQQQKQEAERQPVRELRPVGQLTEYAPKHPDKHKDWRKYEGKDGRLYFVERGSSSPGTWWKPDALLDVSEAITGWQELRDKHGRLYYYHHRAGTTRKIISKELRDFRELVRMMQGGGSTEAVIDKTAELVNHHTREANSQEEASRMSTEYMMDLGMAACPDADVRAQVTVAIRDNTAGAAPIFDTVPGCPNAGVRAGMNAALQERLADMWEGMQPDEERKPQRELRPVGQLTQYPPKYPHRRKDWRVYEHEDGRMYFVKEGDSGPGTWTKPEDLLDIPEYVSGWQQLTDPWGDVYFHYYLDGCQPDTTAMDGTDGMPRDLALARDM